MSTVSKKALSKIAAIGEEARMKVILFLAANANKEAAAVNQIAEAVGLPVVNISHHLGILESCELISKEKAGRSVMVSLNDEVFNPSNKEDTVGYFAFDGFKLALPGSAAASLKAAPKAEKKEKAAPPAPKGKKKAAAPAPKPVEPEDNDDDDDDDDGDDE